jgi:hypothetical protein
MSFPFPIIGNIPVMFKAMRLRNESSKQLFIEYFNRGFGERQPPPIFSEFKNIMGTVIINDPELVNEIYVSKNKYYDKLPKFRNF